jgi:hypothetical protein
MRRPYYHTCPQCGAHLDPGERCTCRPRDGTEAVPPRARRAEIEADQITLAAKVKQANDPGVPIMPLAAPQTAARNGTVKQVPLAMLPHLAVPARARAK